jgi:hypothetical protein
LYCFWGDGTTNLKLGLDSGVASVSLPASFKKAAKKIGAKGSKFAACGVSDVDPTQPVLFLKSSVSATPTEYDLRLSDFEKAESVSGACSTVRSWPGTFIYASRGLHSNYPYVERGVEALHPFTLVRQRTCNSL